MNNKKLRPIQKAPLVPAGYTLMTTVNGRVLVTHTGQPITFPIA